MNEKQNECTHGQPEPGPMTHKASREPNAREHLVRLLEEKHAEVVELEALLKALPLELPFKADRAMRRLMARAGV